MKIATAPESCDYRVWGELPGGAVIRPPEVEVAIRRHMKKEFDNSQVRVSQPQHR